ncbi:MAG: FG-GAP repeat domain-containing protein, partial [Planctomycetota bacterium]
QFDPPQEFPSAGIATIEAVGDLDNDTDGPGGDTDVVIALPDSDEIEVFLNQGGDWNGLLSGGTFGVGDSPSGVALGLFNNDAFLDVAASNAGDGTVSILINQGDATFVAATPLIAGPQPSDVVAADFDGDTLTDLAVSDSFDDTVRIYEGDGLGGFVLVETIGTGGIARVRTGDVDNDKDLDLTGVNRQSSDGPGPTAGNVFVLINTGGSFALDANYPVGAVPVDLAVGDVDGDFIADVVTANFDDDTLTVLLNQGDGTFAEWGGGPVPVGDEPVSVDVVDLDGDLDRDLAVAVGFDSDLGAPGVQAIANALNRGGGLGFDAPIGFDVEGDPLFVLNSDFNADESADLVTVNDEGGGGSVTVLLAADSFLVGPGGFSILFGSPGDGALADLWFSDDGYVELGPARSPIRDRSGTMAGAHLPLVRLEVDGTVPGFETAPTALRAIIEARADAVVSPIQRVALLNHGTGRWELFAERRASHTDETVEILIDRDTGRYIEDGTGAMSLRVDWFDPTNALAQLMGWRTMTDRIVWQVTP